MTEGGRWKEGDRERGRTRQGNGHKNAKSTQATCVQHDRSICESLDPPRGPPKLCTTVKEAQGTGTRPTELEPTWLEMNHLHEGPGGIRGPQGPGRRAVAMATIFFQQGAIPWSHLCLHEGSNGKEEGGGGRGGGSSECGHCQLPQLRTRVTNKNSTVRNGSIVNCNGT